MTDRVARIDGKEVTPEEERQWRLQRHRKALDRRNETPTQRRERLEGERRERMMTAMGE